MSPEPPTPSTAPIGPPKFRSSSTRRRLRCWRWECSARRAVILFRPGSQNFDAALFKRFAITERKQFELRWEVFNSLNRPNFLNPVAAFTNPLFGRLTSARDPRIMQVR